MRVTQNRLKELLDYNPVTGIFTNKINRASVKKGDVAGTLNGHGYWQLSVDNEITEAHRLVWLYEYGYAPSGQIDHIDGNPLNNRISNLRDVTSSDNSRNQARRSDNKTGITGVYYCKQRNKYCVQISSGNKRIRLGRFETIEEAKAVREAAEVKYNYHPNHGRDKAVSSRSNVD